MAEAFNELLSKETPDIAQYETLYKHFHSFPELSLQEKRTASEIAAYLESLNGSLDTGYTIHSSIGGHGLAAVLENGAGPTVLLRADIDALPVLELTGLPYASKVSMTDNDGIEKPVMHACGHDMHITCLLAAADQLAHTKAAWRGTLIVLFQPNEERGGGAQAMVEDGLYDKIPKPDVVLGQHVFPIRTGSVASRPGTIMGASDRFKVTLYGRGGHGSMPHTTIDPVILAANVVQRLQSIVSREIDPAESAVVTVASLQAGATENVIADQAVLRVDARFSTPATREKMLESIHRIIRAECDASNCPKPPLIEQTTHFPLTVNDESLASKVSSSFTSYFGSSHNPHSPMSNASEDVSVLATSIGKPCFFWFFGGVNEEKWDEAVRKGSVGEDIPTNHSAYFAPVVQPTLKTGLQALCVAALACLDRAPL